MSFVALYRSRDAIAPTYTPKGFRRSCGGRNLHGILL